MARQRLRGLVAVKSMLSRSSTTVSISTTEPERLRTLFDPEELKRIAFVSPATEEQSVQSPDGG
jgi:hypothetical protein